MLACFLGHFFNAALFGVVGFFIGAQVILLTNQLAGLGCFGLCHQLSAKIRVFNQLKALGEIRFVQLLPSFAPNHEACRQTKEQTGTAHVSNRSHVAAF